MAGKIVNRYRKISVKMWGDDKFCALSRPKPNAQTLWIYLLTGPHTTSFPGAFMSGEAALAEAMDWPLTSFRKAFMELFEKGMVQADWKTRLVFIPNALRHNPPENPNVVVGWRAAFNELPECPLKALVFASARTYLEELASEREKGEALVKAFGEEYLKEFGKTDTDTDTDTEQNIGKTARKTRAPDQLEITESMRQWARENGITVDLDAETAAMLDHHRAKGNLHVDWVATWRTWMRNSKKYGGHRESEAQAKQRRTREASEQLLRLVDAQTGGGVSPGD